MRRLLFVCIAVLFATTLLEAAQSDVPLLLRFPTVSKTQIVFNYGGDFWIVGRDGGEARRLTSGVGTEALPYFSPDGSMVAFTGEYEGNRDVYVVPAAGGVPRRLTYHPAEEYVAGWTPDGKKILFNSWANSFMHFEDQLYTVPVDGGFPTPIASPDRGRRVFLARRVLIWPTFRIPSGSKPGSATTADRQLRSGSRISKIRASSKFRERTRTTITRCGSGIRFISCPTEMAQSASLPTIPRRNRLRRLCTAMDSTSKRLPPGRTPSSSSSSGRSSSTICKHTRLRTSRFTWKVIIEAVRPHFAKVEPKRIQNYGISPTGARALFEAWGEIFTDPNR